jgi:hypothetical protein
MGFSVMPLLLLPLLPLLPLPSISRQHVRKGHSCSFTLSFPVSG